VYDKNKTSLHPFVIIIVISGDVAPMGQVVRGGVAIPQRWVQILAKLAKRLPSYGRGFSGWGRGWIYIYVAFSHFSLFTSRALEMVS
jgi:hypothetical protein